MNFIKYLVERQISFIEEKENLVRKEKKEEEQSICICNVRKLMTLGIWVCNCKATGK